MFPENHHVAVATGIASSLPRLVASSDDFCCDHIFLFPGSCVETMMSAKLIYVLSSIHMLFCAFYIHIHVKLIKFSLNLVL